jgi:cytochrome P450 family 135
VTGAGLPPGPPLPWPLQAPLFLGGPRWLALCRRRYGDRFTIRLGPFGTYVYLTDPADVRAVFHGADRLFHAGEANGPLLGRVLGPTSVLVTDEEQHTRQRRRLTGAFHGDSVVGLAPRMATIAAAEVEQWPVGRSFPVLPRMRAITLEVILQTVIGVTDEVRLGPLRAALLRLTDIPMWQMAQFPLPGLSSHRPWRSFWAGKAAADVLLEQEIKMARSDPEMADRPDVLARLVRHRESDGTAMADDELRDQIVTLLLAGHETTATGLAWALERLTRYPAVLARATSAARGGDDAYLDAVVAETLRARPVVPDVARRLTGPYRLGPYDLPAGTFVIPGIALIHRSGRHYPDPERFQPERFLGRRPDPLIWLPFGGGSRRCLGAAFAATEMRVVLGEVLRRVELEPTGDRPERARMRHVTLVPHRGGRIRVAGYAEGEDRRVAGAAPVATSP